MNDAQRGGVLTEKSEAAFQNPRKLRQNGENGENGDQEKHRQ